jgi:hypothetical protein
MSDIETAMVNCGGCSMPTRVDFYSLSKGRVYKVCKCVLPNVNENRTFDLTVVEAGE